MPGPKMGPRPVDFDEEIIKQSPTFIKWQSLVPGEKLRYACREFTKEHGDDEERLMRRIMIARRNNIRDHEVLKRARKEQQQPTDVVPSASAVVPPPTPVSSNVVIKTEQAIPTGTAAASTSTTQPKASSTTTRRRRPAYSFSDQQVEAEMDVAAVEATRSYRAWQELKEGSEFVYNQKYIKGHDGHDWLLRKNIWRRMRYRRDCKKLVEQLKGTAPGLAPTSDAAAAATVGPQGTTLPSMQPSFLATVKQEPVYNAETGKSALKRKRGRPQLHDQQHDVPPVYSLAEVDAMAAAALGGSAAITEQVTVKADTSATATADTMNVTAPAAGSAGRAVMTNEANPLLDSEATVQKAAEQAAAMAVEEAAAVESLVMHDADHAAVTAAAAAAAAVVADQEAIEAAVAAAESFGKTQHILSSTPSTSLTATSLTAPTVDHHHHHAHPMDTAALDAAAKLAAATAMGPDEDSEAATAVAAAVAASAENLYAVASGELPQSSQV